MKSMEIKVIMLKDGFKHILKIKYLFSMHLINALCPLISQLLFKNSFKNNNTISKTKFLSMQEREFLEGQLPFKKEINGRKREKFSALYSILNTSTISSRLSVKSQIEK